MRHKIAEDKKRKKVSFTVDPKVYELWEKYCKDNGIENYSDFIEKVILDKINKKEV